MLRSRRGMMLAAMVAELGVIANGYIPQGFTTKFKPYRFTREFTKRSNWVKAKQRRNKQ